MFMMKNNRYSQTSFEEAGNGIQQSNWQYYVSLLVRKFHKIDYAA